MRAEVIDYGFLGLVCLAAVASLRWAAGGMWSVLAVAALAITLLLPLFLTSDRYLAMCLPHIAPLGSDEPFAEYFLFYLPLTAGFAVILASLLIGIASRTATNPLRRLRSIS